MVVVGCLNDPLRRRMLEVIGLHDIRFDDGYDPRSAEAAEFGEQLMSDAEAVFLGRTTQDWLSYWTAPEFLPGPCDLWKNCLTSHRCWKTTWLPT